MLRSDAIRDLNVSVIQMIEAIIERGLGDGTFRRKADPIDVHMLISAFCFFRVRTATPSARSSAATCRSPDDRAASHDDRRCRGELSEERRAQRGASVDPLRFISATSRGTRAKSIRS